MNEELNPMKKFDFLLGAWKLGYHVPKSQFSEQVSGEGEGEFRRILNDRYVTFDYRAKLTSGSSAAHAIFAWDNHYKIYRYWWYEDSGEFMKATCSFLDENTLCLNWHNSLLVQTFNRTDDGKIFLQMKYPSGGDGYKSVLDVTFTKKEY